MMRDEPRWARKVRNGKMGYGRTRALHLLKQAGISLDVSNYKRTWPIVFRLHFPPALDLDDNELALSLGEEPWKAPLPDDWPRGALRRAEEEIAAAARFSDEVAAAMGLFDDHEDLEEEEVIIPRDVEIDVTNSRTESFAERYT